MSYVIVCMPGYNPNKVYSYHGFLFNFTMVSQVSGSMTGPDLKLLSVGGCMKLVIG